MAMSESSREEVNHQANSQAAICCCRYLCEIMPTKQMDPQQQQHCPSQSKTGNCTVRLFVLLLVKLLLKFIYPPSERVRAGQTNSSRHCVARFEKLSHLVQIISNYSPFNVPTGRAYIKLWFFLLLYVSR